MIGKDKERINFTISKSDKAILLEIAQAENRTLSNTVNVAIKEFIKAHSPEQAHSTPTQNDN